MKLESKEGAYMLGFIWADGVVEASSKENIEKIGSYIYDTFPEDKIGLDRKYNKWVEIINSYVRK